jgi:hypothetical protein
LTQQPHRPGQLTGDAYAAAIYGTVVATALVSAFRESHFSSKESTLSLLSTIGVFFLAHTWSAIAGERIHLGNRFSRHHSWEIVRSEWPLVEAGLAPAMVLLLGWAGMFGERTASTVALGVCGLQLLGWGFAVGHRAFDRWWQAVLSALGSTMLGAVLVALEAAVLH